MKVMAYEHRTKSLETLFPNIIFPLVMYKGVFILFAEGVVKHWKLGAQRKN